MEKKTLYIRLDSSPLPEESDEVIVKDFNLENYFCTLLGRRLLEDAMFTGTISYPGKLIADFKKSDKKAYREIVQQWRKVLINLLNAIHIQNGEYKISLPLPYTDWLRNNYNDVFKQLPLAYNNELVIQISREFVYNEIIKNVLLRKTHILLTRIGDNIQRITFSVDVFIQNSTFMEAVSKCAGYQIWEKIKIGFFPYEDCHPYSEGLAAVKKNGEWGFVDKEGNEIIPKVYQMVDDFSEGLVAVCQKDKWGYIDKERNEIIQCIYDKVGSFSRGLAMVRKNGEYHVINKYGNEVISKTYTLAFLVSYCAISEGLIAVRDVKSHRYGFLDDKGKEVIPCVYLDIDRFSEGLAAVKIKEESKQTKKTENGLETLFNSERELYGFINKKGIEVIPCIYDKAYRFSEGLAIVLKNGKYGFIDKKGVEVIPCIYDSVYDFSEGVAKVEKEGKYGFINKRGYQIIPCIYEKDSIADSFVDKFAWVKNGKYGFIDKEGKEIIPCIYDYASDFCKEWAYFFSKSNLIEKRGLVNEKGEEFIFINRPQHCLEGMICVREGEYGSKDCRYNFIPAQWLKDL